MRHRVVAHWLCRPCEVEGRDEHPEPECWNCGGAVVVTARPTIPIGDGGADPGAPGTGTAA